MRVSPDRRSVHRSAVSSRQLASCLLCCRDSSRASIRQSHTGRNKRQPSRSNRLERTTPCFNVCPHAEKRLRCCNLGCSAMSALGKSRHERGESWCGRRFAGFGRLRLRGTTAADRVPTVPDMLIRGVSLPPYKFPKQLVVLGRRQLALGHLALTRWRGGNCRRRNQARLSFDASAAAQECRYAAREGIVVCAVQRKIAVRDTP